MWYYVHVLSIQKSKLTYKIKCKDCCDDCYLPFLPQPESVQVAADSLAMTGEGCHVAEAQISSSLNKIEVYFSTCKNRSHPVSPICEPAPTPPTFCIRAVATAPEHKAWALHLTPEVVMGIGAFLEM